MQIKIATRKSELALWQAEHVRLALLALNPGLRVELVRMSTQGDRILDTPLAKIGGKGLFVKELENGLLLGNADIAVHSMKDVPVDLPLGLALTAILEREDPRDAFVSNHWAHLDELPMGAHVGTSSLRRQCQLKRRRPDLRISALRGNVNTRLNKLDQGEYDAIILAAAGLKRLGLAARIRETLSIEIMLPAIGQGAIGIESRADNVLVNALLEPLNHTETALCLRAERALNRALQGGCQVPIGGYARIIDTRLELTGLVGEPDGSLVLSGQEIGPVSAGEALGETLAQRLLQQGAKQILERVYANS